MSNLISLGRDKLQFALDGLSHRENKLHFQQSLSSAVAAGVRLTPYLLRWLDYVHENPEIATQFGNPLKTTAVLFLLASLKERSAWFPVLRLMACEEPSFYELVEEEALENASRILGSIGEAEDLMEGAADSRCSLELRENCIDGLLLQFSQKKIDFKLICDFLYSQWHQFRVYDYEYWRTCMLTSFFIADEERYEDIRYFLPRIRESYRNDLQQTLQQGVDSDGDAFRSGFIDSPEFKPITNPMYELENRLIFNEISVKIDNTSDALGLICKDKN